MTVNGFGFPLSPAPSPVPSIRRLRVRPAPRPECAVDDREQDIMEIFRKLEPEAKGRVLKQLLRVAPRDALLDAQSVISPRLKHDPFKLLPVEVSLKILSYIRDPKSLAAAAQVSRLWYFLLSDDSTWKQLCRDHHFRRLSAAGSYVHHWNRYREREIQRASSQAIEESPEVEELAAGAAVSSDLVPSVSRLRFESISPFHSTANRSREEAHTEDERCENEDRSVSPRAPLGQESTADGLLETPDIHQTEPMHLHNPFPPYIPHTDEPAAPHSEQFQGEQFQPEQHQPEQFQDEQFSGERFSGEQAHGEQFQSEQSQDESQEEQSHDEQEEPEQTSQPLQHPETGQQTPQQVAEVVPHPFHRRTDARRNSLLGNQPDHILNNVLHLEQPLMQYGSRLPNFDSEMHRHLANTADPAGDPIGEAYYDPQAFVTSPPDSYRSHFRQQYLLNQAWAQGGWLAGRYSLPHHEGAIVTTVLMQDGFIVVALDTSLILVFNDSGKLLRSLYGHVMGVWALALKGHTLLSGGCDRDVREWDLRSGACQKILRGHSSTVRCLAMATPDLALSGGRDAVIRVWDLKDGKSLYRLVGHTGSVRRLEVATVDGTTYAVSASYDCTAKVWNVENGTLLHTLVGHTNQIYSLAVDGGRIATGSLDHSICVWDLRLGAKLATLLGHSALVGQLCLRGNTLVSGGSDGAVRIWDLENMVCAHRIAAHDNTVTCLRLSEDRIITGGPDCRVQMWNVRTGKHIRQFYKESVSTVWGIAAGEDRLLTVYSEGASIVIELMSFAPT